MRLIHLFISLLIGFIGNSQTEWQSLNGPFGGSVDVLIQSENLTLFAGTKQGLFRRPIDNSEWTFISELGDAAILSMTEGEGELYISNENVHSIYRSVDDGENWTLLPLESENIYEQLALSSGGTLVFAEGSSIWITSDKGQSTEWVQLPGDIRVLCLSAADDGRLFAGTNKGLYASKEDGREWSEFKNGLPSDLFITQLVIDQNGRTAFSTVDSRIFILEPSDTTFQEHISGLEDIQVTSLGIDTSLGLLTGTLQGTMHLLDSLSDTWIVLPYSQSNAASKILAIIVSKQKGIYFARASKGVELYDENCSCTISLNQGLTASEIQSMIVAADERLIVSTKSGLFWRSPSDETWNEMKIESQDLSSRCLLQTSDGKIYACTSDGVLEIVLDDSNALVNAIGPFGVSVIFLEEDDQNRLLAGSFSDGLFRQENDSREWVDLRTTEMLDAILTDIHFSEDSSIYISYHQGIFKSEDGGENWKIAIDGIPQVGSLITDSDGNIFGSSFPGVVRSTDGGDQWQQVAVGDGLQVSSLLSVDGDVLLAGSREGVFSSEDVGQTWVPFSEGLQIKSVGNLAQDLAGNIFAGTLGGGVYKLEADVTATNRISALPLEMQISPNPTNGLTILSISQDFRGIAGIRVYSSDFRLVFEEDQHRTARGRLELDLSTLKQGLYFLSVIMDEGRAIAPFIKM